MNLATMELPVGAEMRKNTMRMIRRAVLASEGESNSKAIR
jgi:hypothetical protein